jgi:hypothetical protein
MKGQGGSEGAMDVWMEVISCCSDAMMADGKCLTCLVVVCGDNSNYENVSDI